MNGLSVVNKRTAVRVTKQQLKQIRDVDLSTTKELNKQIQILYPATTIVLWTNYGFRVQRIARCLVSSQEIWEDIGDNDNAFALKLLEEETGLELTCADGESWHDKVFFDAEKKAECEKNPKKYIAMRRKQIKWIAPSILGCILIAMHREYGWGAKVRLQRLLYEVDEVRQMYKMDYEKIAGEMERVTGGQIMRDAFEVR